MRLSTQTEVIGIRLGDDQAVKILCEAGFDALDYSMFRMHQDSHVLNQPDYEKHLDLLKQIAADYQVSFNQAHAPFPVYIEDAAQYNQITLERVKRAMEAAAYLGADSIVVHPVALSDKDKTDTVNFEIYAALQPLCEKLGIKVALENLWGQDQNTGHIYPNVCSTGDMFNAYLDALDRKWFVGCLDLGHCGLVDEDAATMIRQMGAERLKALHVHDNDHRQDLHYIPFTGKLDWQSITSALSEIGYSGDMTLEADNFFVNMPEDFLPDAAKFLHDVGRQLIKMTQQPKAIS